VEHPSDAAKTTPVADGIKEPEGTADGARARFPSRADETEAARRREGARDTVEWGRSPGSGANREEVIGERAEASTDTPEPEPAPREATGQSSASADGAIEEGTTLGPPTTSNKEDAEPPSSHSQARVAEENFPQIQASCCTAERVAKKPASSVSKQLREVADTSANHDVLAAAVEDGSFLAREALVATASL